MLFFSVLINRLFLKFSGNLGIRNSDETIIRWSSQSKPAVGGFSFYIIFLFSIVTHFLIFEPDHISDLPFLGILASVTLAFLIGLADDAYNTNPLLKFLGQLSCALIIIATGTVITIFENNTLNYILTILWVVGMMNSLNMLDNMDAITTLVSISIIISLLIIIHSYCQIPGINFMVLLGILGSLLGFLLFNWHPSKIYMGDTGSQFLGCLLSLYGIKYLWNFRDDFFQDYPSRQIILVALAFIIPIADTTAVVINRLRRGQSPFVGGKDHTTHHLSYLGLSDRKVAYFFILLSIVTLFFVFLIVNFIDYWNFLYFYAFAFFAIAVASGLYYITRISKNKGAR
jgi:UDP-GlcNAc:undecaprenyl-phosphate/decaprenyl-phosphate GlcNAc-1-phosphate transferase